MLKNIKTKEEPLLGESPKEVWFSKPIFLYLVIFLLLVIIIGGWFRYKPTDISELESKIKKSELKIDSLSLINSGLNSKIIDLKQDIQFLNDKLDDNLKELDNNQKEFNEKDKNIDTYSYDQLYNDVTRRYSRYYENDIPN